MARYFLNVRHKPGPGGLAVDPDGDEIADIALVREHAFTTARDLITRTQLDSIPNWFDCTFEIIDEAGQLVLTVPFTDTGSEDMDPSSQRMLGAA